MRRSVIIRAAMLALVVGMAGRVAAQSTPGAAQAPQPPFAVGGWRYEPRDQGFYMFYCQQPSCGTDSRVSYRFYAPGTTITLEQFRKDQDTIVKALEQRAPPGTRISVIKVEGDEGNGDLRVMKAHRQTLRPDGSKEFLISGIVVARGGTGSLISSSADEKVVDGNYNMFLLPLMLTLAKPPPTEKPQ